ncbi:MAG TPA: MmcQ/YjbR family DNA-binding protein [Terriglobales bacterium]|nr:MmcQ/YjbR family DNA-binding protein [Terriglobales bacterium]
MSVEFVREVSMSLPHVTEQIQWEDHLLFKVGGKMFAVTSLGPVGVRLSVKSTPEKFAELTEIPGVIPAPYMARNFWVALERWDAVRRSELEELIRESYQLVLAKLPKKKQAELAGKSVREPAGKKPGTRKKTSAVKKKAARRGRL